MSAATTQALAVRKEEHEVVLKLVSGGPVDNLVRLQERIQALSKVANVLMPTVASPVIPPKMAVALSVVQIDTETNSYGQGREVYFDRRFCDRESDEVALGKVALLKILGAAGISVVESRRLDDGRDPHYVIWQVMLAGRDLTGQWIQSPGTKEIDLRDGSALLMKPEKVEKNGREIKTGKLVRMDDSAIGDLRKNLLSNAETKAILRATRGFPGLGIAQKYRRSVAARLWVVPRLVQNLDMSDPADAQFAREQAAGNIRQLFGRGAAAPPELAPAPPVSKVTHAPIDVTATPAAENRPRAEEETPDDDREGGEGPDDTGDFEPLDLKATTEAPKVCVCPCGCQSEVHPDAAVATVAHYGDVRCAACFPGRRFNVKKHEDVKDLRLPKAPALTVENIRRGLEHMKATAGK